MKRWGDDDPETPVAKRVHDDNALDCSLASIVGDQE
jgi:hypothetical protein